MAGADLQDSRTGGPRDAKGERALGVGAPIATRGINKCLCTPLQPAHLPPREQSGRRLIDDADISPPPASLLPVALRVLHRSILSPPAGSANAPTSSSTSAPRCWRFAAVCGSFGARLHLGAVLARSPGGQPRLACPPAGTPQSRCPPGLSTAAAGYPNFHVFWGATTGGLSPVLCMVVWSRSVRCLQCVSCWRVQLRWRSVGRSAVGRRRSRLPSLPR